MSTTRIIVTGGAGFIGSNLVTSLVRSGQTVLNIDKLTYAGNLQSLSGIANAKNYSFSKTDIVDGKAVRELVSDFKPQAILHLAAESHVDRSIDNPAQFIETNVLGTFHVLQAALEHWKRLSVEEARQFRLVHISTDEVFGSLGTSGYFTEDTPYAPHSPYSASKAGSDHLVRAWHDTYGLPTIVTNCSNNYGPFQFPEKLIPVVVLRSLRGEPIPVYGNGQNVRDWLFVEDHCEALELALAKGKPGETYNIGGNNEITNIELVRRICQILDELHPSPNHASYANQITFVADRPGHDLRYAIDSSKIRAELGWSPKHDSHSGLRKTIEWYLKNRTWWEDILSGTYKLERLGLS